jgi:hypothetical protein
MWSRALSFASTPRAMRASEGVAAAHQVGSMSTPAQSPAPTDLVIPLPTKAFSRS